MLHKSRILLLLLAVYLTAVIYFIFREPNTAYIFIFPPFIICWFFRRSKIVFYSAIVSLIVIFASWQLTNTIKEPLKPGDNQVSGYIVKEPSISDRKQTIIVESDSGYRTIAFIDTYPEYLIGQQVTLRGNLLPREQDEYYQGNPGYYRLNKVQYVMADPEFLRLNNPKQTGIKEYLFIMRRGLIGIRKAYEDIIGQIFAEPYSGLAKGILLGTRSNLDRRLNNLFITVGVIHIMALSGYNITIISDNLKKISQRFSTNFSFWFAIVGIWAFVLATGLSASAVRAAFMGSMLLIAKRTGRQSDSLVALLLTAAVMVFVNPNIIIYDIGFQLSFAAMAGLIFLAPRLEIHLRPLGRLFGGILATTIAAQIFTFPLLSYHFGRFSTVAIIANILILPLIPMTMGLIFLISTIGFVSLWLAQGLSLILWLVLSYFIKVSEVLGGLTQMQKNYEISLPVLIGVYLLIIELSLLLPKNKKITNEQN